MNQIRVLLLGLIFGLCTSVSAFANLTVKTRTGEEVQLVVASSDVELSEDRDVFVQSFCQSYQSVPFSEINPLFKTIEDLRQWLSSGFDEDIPEIKEGINSGKIYYVRAFLRDQLVGLISFEREPAKANAVYVKQIAISPRYQRMGIGKHLLFSIKSDPSLLPATKTIYLVTRRFNRQAIEFYEKIGFRVSSYVHEGYDPSRYVGLEWHEKLD